MVIAPNRHVTKHRLMMPPPLLLLAHPLHPQAYRWGWGTKTAPIVRIVRPATIALEASLDTDMGVRTITQLLWVLDMESLIMGQLLDTGMVG